MAKVQIEGTEIDLEDHICADDKTLKAALLPFYPAVENATIKRSKEGDTTTITVTKRAGTKGNFAPALEALKEAPEEISPILVIQATGWKKYKGSDFDDALLKMFSDRKEIDRVTKALDQSTSQSAQTVPVGF